MRNLHASRTLGFFVYYESSTRGSWVARVSITAAFFFPHENGRREEDEAVEEG